jgi:hypothetical protein
MNNILKIIESAAIDALIDLGIEEIHEMLELHHEGGTEIIRNFAKKGMAFGHECKYTLLEKNEETLDIIISRPGMEDTTYRHIEKSSGITLDALPVLLKYVRIARLENPVVEQKRYTRGKNKYYRTTIYPDKKLYDSLRKNNGK